MMKAIDTHFDGQKAFSYVEHMTQAIGPRLTGSEGEHQAARYIQAMFKSFGLKARLQEFDVETFDVESRKFQVEINGTWREIPIQPIGLSGSTPKNGFTAELHYAECGQPEYFTPEMEGKIVLICGGVGEKHRYQLLQHKPRAIIFIEAGLTPEPMRVNLREEALEAYKGIPLGRITHLDGLDIVKSKAKRGKLKMINTSRQSHCYNVIGELKGTDSADEIVVVCGHYDTSRNITGASDNAGGTAIVMELARVLAQSPSRRTVRFIAFAGEETGLQGSRHYAEALVKKAKAEKKKKTFDEKLDKTELDRHVLVYNIDVHGCVLGTNSFNYSGQDDLASLVRLLSKEVGIPANISKGPMSSDGSVLAAEGVPALQFARHGGTTGYLHSTLDEIKYLSPEALAQAGVFSEVLLRRHVTEAVSMPVPREIPDDQTEALKRFKMPAKKETKSTKSTSRKRPATKKATRKRR